MRWLILGAAGLGVGMLVASLWMQPRLVWNFTPSIPTGLYRLEDRNWVKGDRVAVQPSGQLADALNRADVLKTGRLLLKRVAAAKGDVVCRSGGDVRINAVLVAVARQGEGLPSWAGCRSLGPDEILLLGETPDSFDGRYFGVSAAGDVLGPLTALMMF